LGRAGDGSAYFQAINKMAGYLIIPIVGIEIVVLEFAYGLFVKGSKIDNRSVLIATMIAIYVVVAYGIVRRWAIYVDNLPELKLVESVEESRFAFWFYGILVGVVGFTFIFVFGMRQIGFSFLPSN
jgi:hypothetical protein